MSFAFPLVLGLLLPIGFALYRANRAARRPVLVFSGMEGLRALPRTGAQRAKRWLGLLPWLGLAALVVALARPQTVRSYVESEERGVSILLVIDRSESMLQTDLEDPAWRGRPRTRLDVVKEVVRDFVDVEDESAAKPSVDASGRAQRNVLPGRPQDRIGLVSFAGYAQSLCPVTLDHEALLETLADVRITRRSAEDPEAHLTAIGDALSIAIARLRDVDSRSKVIVLLSDGESNVGAVVPKTAAEIAAAEGIRVHTIGVGSSGQGFDEKTLRAIAERTGGQYFSAAQRAELEQVYRDIDALETTRHPPRLRVVTAEQYRWPLIAGLVALFLHVLLVSTRFRSLP
jgi:Ca-activated chloride channel family protein